MIDTHCHLDDARFDGDREAVLDRAAAVGVQAVVVPAIWPSHWMRLAEWAAREPRVVVGAGIHPQAVPELSPADDALHLEQLDVALASGGFVAVGECGIDGPTAQQPGGEMARQVALFAAHVRLAHRYGLPLLVHAFHAHPEVRAVLEAEGVPEAGCVLHSYSGGAELSKVFVKLGCHLSLAGAATWPKARRPLESAKAIPLDRLLLETDAPDQTPAPHRGLRNEPAFLPHTARVIAEARGITVEALVEATDENARRLFRRAFPVTTQG